MKEHKVRIYGRNINDYKRGINDSIRVLNSLLDENKKNSENCKFDIEKNEVLVCYIYRACQKLEALKRGEIE